MCVQTGIHRLRLVFCRYVQWLSTREMKNVDVENLEKRKRHLCFQPSIGAMVCSRIFAMWCTCEKDTFNRALTRDIADEIGAINSHLKKEGRRYVLIGPGRWGSADWRLGVPVLWGQISNVGCIVETDLKDLRVSPSQGSHFFQNITSFGIGYFYCPFHRTGLFAQYELARLLPGGKGNQSLSRLVRFQEPLDIAVDSRTAVGVVMKEGLRAPRRLD